MRKNTKYKAFTAVGAVAALTLSAAPMAHAGIIEDGAAAGAAAGQSAADGSTFEQQDNADKNIADGALAGLFGPVLAAPIPVCGESNVVPLQVANLTDVAQTGSMTVDGDVAEQIKIIEGGSASDSACNPRNGSGWFQQNGNSWSNNFTVEPQSIMTVYISMGGVDENIALDNQFSIGGLPNGAPNAQWYDFNLNLNGDGSFSELLSSYSNTGGTDPTTNTQKGFNLLSCTPQSVNAPTSVLTPYQSHTTPGPTYKSGDPLCMGWLPEGQMIPTSSVESAVASGPAAPLTVNAAQYNSTLGTVSASFGIPGVQNVTSVQVMDSNQVQVNLPNSPSGGGFWTQQTFTVPSNGYAANTLIVEGIPAYSDTQILVETSINGNNTQNLITIPTPSPTGSLLTTALSLNDPNAPDESVIPLTPPTPSTSDYQITVTGGLPNIEPYGSILSVGDTNASVQVGYNVSSQDIPDYPGGGATLTSITMPDGSSVAVNKPVLIFGEQQNNFNLSTINPSNGQLYTGTYNYVFNFEFTNGFGFSITASIVADPETVAEEESGDYTPLVVTPEAPSSLGITASDYSITNVTSPSWATMSAEVTGISGDNLQVAVTFTPNTSFDQQLADADAAVEQMDVLKLVSVTLPSGVNTPEGNWVTAFPTSPVTKTVNLPLAGASGNYYSGTFMYTLTFSYGEGEGDQNQTSQASLTIAANPPADATNG